MILKTSEMPFTLPNGVMFVNLCKNCETINFGIRPQELVPRVVEMW